MSEPSSCAKMFRVYLQNDNYNMKEYVSRCLMMVMDASAADARAIMMQANKNRWSNRALCGIWEEPPRTAHSRLLAKGRAVNHHHTREW